MEPNITITIIANCKGEYHFNINIQNVTDMAKEKMHLDEKTQLIKNLIKELELLDGKVDANRTEFRF